MAKRKTVYTKERNRIMSNLRRLKKKGLKIQLYFPTEKELRSQGVKGKELSKLTRELKKWKSTDITAYVESEQINYTQVESNTPGFEPPTNISEDASFFDGVVITGFKAHVRQFNERASTLLLNWLDRILQTNDAHDVALMLQNGAEAGLIVTYQIVYSQDKLTQYMSEMLDYLPEAGPLFKAEMMDALEQEEDYNSFA